MPQHESQLCYIFQWYTTPCSWTVIPGDTLVINKYWFSGGGDGSVGGGGGNGDGCDGCGGGGGGVVVVVVVVVVAVVVVAVVVVVVIVVVSSRKHLLLSPFLLRPTSGIPAYNPLSVTACNPLSHHSSSNSCL
jgi:hypothetical protein